ncbi:MAG: 5-formyltetrahydrofolate cyclo-ligase [Verrucomicrobiaceae bacterium]|nr:MAG: 5-formyltetrahydrofolate cyclo-ligase [Verrucomicrobiaceae bacterium]
MRRLLRERTADGAAARAALERWLARQSALRTIAVFAALPGEVDLMEVIARHPERRWVYPRVAGVELRFHYVAHPQGELIPGAFGVREPAPALPLVAVGEIDAFLCPGLAFDPRGGRLGRGRGFYDRLLAKARPGALKIGVCFPEQIVADTFPEAHDVLMDEMIS